MMPRMWMCYVFNDLPANYVMDAVVVTEAGAEDVDEFNPSEFGIDPFAEVEMREGFYGDERRVPAMLIEAAAPDADGEFVAAVLTLEDYKLLA